MVDLARCPKCPTSYYAWRHACPNCNAANIPEGTPAMTTLPEAAKLARKTLGMMKPWDAYDDELLAKAITALDAALASSAEPTEPVAWCSLTKVGTIAYFDGKPMVMPGKVGNDCHPHPLYIGSRALPSRTLVPEGFMLVPTAPTPEMQQAGVKELRAAAHGTLDYQRVCAVYHAMLYTTPPAQAEPSAQEPAGIELAVRWLEMRRDDYVHEFGSYDPETGATEYGRGAKGQAREEYVAEIEEVIEGIRALAACDVPPAGWSCSRSMGHEGPCAATPSPQDSASVAGALVAGCEVITPPGAAIRASVIHLTDAGREALTAKGVKSIPGVQAAPVAAALDTLWAGHVPHVGDMNCDGSTCAALRPSAAPALAAIGADLAVYQSIADNYDRDKHGAPAAREVELPTNEQLELFAQKLVREKRLTWSGFRDDGTVPDRQNYTIPVISQSVGDLVRAALQSAASGREDSAMLDWLLSHPNEVFEEAGNEWFVLDADSTPTYFKSGREALRAAMNTTKGAEQ
jgi:hypothetical protein